MANDDFPPTLPEAATEIADAIAYLERKNTTAARDLAVRVAATVALVKALPESGSPTFGGMRRLLLRTHAYALIYRVTEGQVRIIAFAHTSRKPGYWLDRLS